LSANVSRQWGTYLKQQLNIGYQATDVVPSLLPDFPSDPALRAAFIHDVFPRSELLAGPYVEYVFFRPRYETIRYLGTYEFAEDLRIGPDLDVVVQQGLQTLGSQFTFTRPSISTGWTFAWGHDGAIRPSIGASMRLQSNAVLPDGQTVGAIDSTAVAQIRAFTPSTKYGRLIAQAYIDTRWHDTQNQLFYIGGDPSLRGYEIDQFYGYRLFSGQLEARSVPFRWWVFRLGGVVFYDVGGAANTMSSLGLFHDVGIGVRSLFPQTSSQLVRLDLAFPLQATPGNGPALVPHFVFSFGSAF
jgi:outer membrane protein assembly factor BamA